MLSILKIFINFVVFSLVAFSIEAKITSIECSNDKCFAPKVLKQNAKKEGNHTSECQCHLFQVTLTLSTSSKLNIHVSEDFKKIIYIDQKQFQIQNYLSQLKRPPKFC